MLSTQEYNLHAYSFSDFTLEDDETLKATLRMFIDLNFLELFDINYEVSNASFSVLALAGCGLLNQKCEMTERCQVYNCAGEHILVITFVDNVCIAHYTAALNENVNVKSIC